MNDPTPRPLSLAARLAGTLGADGGWWAHRARRYTRPLLFVFSLFSVWLAGWAHARWQFLLQVREIYPEYEKLSVPEFILHGLPGDMLISLLALLPIISLLIIFRRRSWRGPGPWLTFASWILASFTLAFSQVLNQRFFQLFESPVNLKLTGTGVGSFWSELLPSILVEITPEIRQRLLFQSVFYAAFFLIGWSVLLRYRALSFRPALSLALAQPLLVWLPLLLYAGLALPDRATEFQKQKKSAKQAVGLEQPGFGQFTRNPLLLLWDQYHEKSRLVKPEPGSLTEKAAGAESPRAILRTDLKDFNTISLVNKNQPPFGRIEAIERGKKYNIVFYFLESVSASYMGMKHEGKPVTPRWDALAKSSFVANNHYAHYPLSINGLYTVLSSSYDYPGRGWTPMLYPRIRARTALEILKEKNYRTGIFLTGSYRNFGQNKFLHHRGVDKVYQDYQLKKPPYNKLLGSFVDDRSMIAPGVKFMAESERPFFTMFFPGMPHHPYKIPEEKYRVTGPYPKDAGGRKRRWLNYVNSLHYADAVLGMLIDKMKAGGLLENTLLFVFADHGEAFYQHRGNYLHSLFLYEENVRVPFLLYTPGAFEGPNRTPVRYNGVSRHIDILPTLLDILDLPRDKNHVGISLFRPHRPQVALLHTFWSDQYIALRDGPWKFIYKPATGRQELFDLRDDPEEKENLATQRPLLSRQFRDYLLRAQEYKKDHYKILLERR